jgi:hypothetical protein
MFPCAFYIISFQSRVEAPQLVINIFLRKEILRRSLHELPATAKLDPLEQGRSRHKRYPLGIAKAVGQNSHSLTQPIKRLPITSIRTYL